MRSTTLAHDLCRGSKAELKASGIGSDHAAVEHLAGCFADARRELEQAADVLAEAEERLLTVAVETPPPSGERGVD